MKRAGLLSLLVLLVAGCSTIQVTSDYNPETDFSTLKSYAWLGDAAQPGTDVRITDPLVVDSVRAAVERNLAAKGFVATDRDRADFLIAWFGGIERKISTENLDRFYAPYGYGTLYRDPYWNKQQSGAGAGYEEGSLIFDVIDTDRQTLLWRGVGRGKLREGQEPEAVRRRIDEAVGRILAEFPPR